MQEIKEKLNLTKAVVKRIEGEIALLAERYERSKENLSQKNIFMTDSDSEKYMISHGTKRKPHLTGYKSTEILQN